MVIRGGGCQEGLLYGKKFSEEPLSKNSNLYDNESIPTWCKLKFVETRLIGSTEGDQVHGVIFHMYL
jgi:hypothetical protein